MDTDIASGAIGVGVGVVPEPTVHEH